MALNCSKLEKSFRWIGVHAILESFLNSTSSLQEAQPCSNWPVPRRRNSWSKYWCQIFEFYYSVFFSIYWTINPQQSDHQFRYLQTIVIKCSWFHVYPLSFMVRKRHRRRRWIWCLLWSCLRNRVSLCSPLQYFQRESLPTSPFCIRWFRSRSWPKKQVLSPNRDSIMIATP